MTSDFSVNMNEYLPLRDVVFNTLRQAILKGELKPGERLMEIALAERLGVSRTPIREAMRKLEQEGLVVMIPRRGAQVANITEKDLNDVLEVRIALENVAIEKACARMTEEEMRKTCLKIYRKREKKHRMRRIEPKNWKRRSATALEKKENWKAGLNPIPVWKASIMPSIRKN